MLDLFKRKTLRLGKHLLKVKVYGKCLPSEQKETSRVGENGVFGCFSVRKGGGQAGAGSLDGTETSPAMVCWR